MEEKISNSEKIKVKPQNIDKVIFTQGNSSLL